RQDCKNYEYVYPQRMDLRADQGIRGGDNEREAKDKDAHEGGEARGFWTSRHECCNRSWRAFVNVRRPDVKRCGCDLETKPDQHHCCACEEQPGIRRLIQPVCDL